MKDKYICLVCGFDGLEEPPYSERDDASYEVCPCCGFEFGFDEEETADKYNIFRSTWIKNGTKWFLPNRKPKDWNFKKQIENLKA